MQNKTQDMINLVLETQYVREGRQLGTAKFDSDGYTVIPLAVLGEETRNRTYYDVPSVTAQLRENTGMLSRLLVDGNLYGEYGHPDVSGLGRDAQLGRMMRIDEKSVSHHIRKIFAGERLPSGGQLLLGEVKPTGVFKDVLMERFMNRFDNTSFSLRAIVAERVRPDGVVHRTVRNLITFDAVNAGGYAQASKRYRPATEGFAIENLRRSDFVRSTGELSFAVENFTVRDVDAIFGSVEIEINRQHLGSYTPGESTFVDEEGRRRSFFHAIMGR